MAQVSESLTVPTAPLWGYATDAATGRSASIIGATRWVEANRYDVKAAETAGDPAEVALIWGSPYSTFQAQWRSRRRYSPAKAQAVYGAQAEQWTEWGEWEGASISGAETATPATGIGTGAGRWAMTDLSPFAFAYDFSEYDYIEVQARVRVYDPSSGKCSEWATRTLGVCYEPTATVTASQNPDGSVTVSFSTNWPRGGWARVRSGPMPDGAYPRVLADAAQLGDSATVDVAVPASKTAGLTQDSTALYARNFTFQAQLGTGSTIQAVKGAWPCAAMAAHPNPSTVAAPVVVLSGDGVSVADAGYSEVFASCWWEDEEGRPHASEIALAKSGAAWSGSMEAPPYDVDVSVRAVAASSDGTAWAQTVQATRIASSGRHSWTLDGGGGASVALMQDTAGASLSESMEGGSAKPAGRERPVSRHGTGGTRALSVSGCIMRGPMAGENAPHSQSGHAEMLAVLRAQEDMWFRTPGGGRFRVRVTDFSLSQHAAHEVLTVSMEEVG